MAIVERVRGAVVVLGGDLFVGVLILTAVAERAVLGREPGVIAVAATWGLPLLARRRLPLLAPLAALVLVGATTLAVPAMSHDTGGELLLAVTAVWMLAAGNPPARALVGLPAAGPVVAAVGPAGDAATVTLLLLGSFAAGVVHHRNQGETALVRGHLKELERTRESSLEAAAADERARIARELHDIVAHSVSVMTVQAGAARLQLAHDPEQALASVTAVEEATTTALDELDRLVGLLGPEEQPIRGLTDVEGLVTQMRDAGLDAHLSVEGEPRPLPAGLDLALYRLLQEALTNARKHAGLVRTDVGVHYGVDEIQLRVVNDLPAGAGRSRGAHGGHGLVGMRERVAMYGGHLAVEPRAGRFHVEVRLPAP
ncbi:MAG: histidine kinase [Egibacteraceae bacterium]